MSSRLAWQHKYRSCNILVTIDLGRYHLSISHPNRYPTWDEIKYARYEYLPDNIFVAMILPSLAHYVNIDRNCFQMWETKDPLADQIWRDPAVDPETINKVLDELVQQSQELGMYNQGESNG